MTPSFTIFLGVAEIARGLGVAFGVLTQLAAIGLILIMLGAIQRKIFVWQTGFWGENASGWHYDLMLVLMNIVIACTDRGQVRSLEMTGTRGMLQHPPILAFLHSRTPRTCHRDRFSIS